MTSIYRWTAKRAGDCITITGQRIENGEPVEIVDVDRIVCRYFGEGSTTIMAIDKDGNEHTLL